MDHWGELPVRGVLVIILLCMSSAAFARSLDMRGCKKEERQEVHKAVRWLVENFDAIDTRMGTSTLMAWPENVRAKFKKRLAKNNFKVSCWRPQKCDKYADESKNHSAAGFPIFHRRRITLCPDRLPDTGAYATVIAHELGHLVYINSDRKTCAERCSTPRLSHSLALATLGAWTGIEFNGLTCLTECVADAEDQTATEPGLPQAPVPVPAETTLPKSLP